MAEGKKSFILYSNQKEIFSKLSDEQAGKLIKHVFEYVNDNDPETDDPFVDLAFTMIKNQLKDDLNKWENQRQQRVEAGKKSAEARRKNRERNSTSVNERSTKSNETERNSTVNGNVNVNVNGNVNDNIIKETKGKKKDIIYVSPELNENNKLVQETIETLYQAYPTTCPVSNRKTSKGKKNKDQIELALRKYDRKFLWLNMKAYVKNCMETETSLKNFTTYLNQMPEMIDRGDSIINEIKIEKPKKKPEVPF